MDFGVVEGLARDARASLANGNKGANHKGSGSNQRLCCCETGIPFFNIS
jgi:hypothetical protein